MDYFPIFQTFSGKYANSETTFNIKRRKDDNTAR